MFGAFPQRQQRKKNIHLNFLCFNDLLYDGMESIVCSGHAESHSGLATVFVLAVVEFRFKMSLRLRKPWLGHYFLIRKSNELVIRYNVRAMAGRESQY